MEPDFPETPRYEVKAATYFPRRHRRRLNPRVGGAAVDANDRRERVRRIGGRTLGNSIGGEGLSPDRVLLDVRQDAGQPAHVGVRLPRPVSHSGGQSALRRMVVREGEADLPHVIGTSHPVGCAPHLHDRWQE